jgi:MFS transporter, ACS family, hexuronate transporter
MPVPLPELRVPERSPNWKWLICGLLLLATTINYMDRLTINLTAKDIMVDFGIDERGYAYLESAFAFAFAVGSIVFGWCVDRYNVRWIYPAAVLAWSMAGFATGLMQGFFGLLVCRFLLGLSEGGNWPSALRTTQRILEPSERPMGNSILQSGAAAGAILTPLVVMGMAALTGSWRGVFLVVGTLGAGWVVLWLSCVRKDDLTVEQGKTSSSLAVIVVPLVLLLGLDIAVHAYFSDDPQLTLATKIFVTVAGIACVFTWLIYGTRDETRLPRRVFITRFCVLAVLVVTINLTWHYFRAWLPLFLETSHGYTKNEMRWFMMAYYIFTDIGTLTAGFITLQLARRYMSVHGSRMAVFCTCALLTTLSAVVAFLPAGPLLLGLLLVIGFAALGLFPNYYSFSQEITVQYQGKVTGALGCTCWLSMSLLHELVGESIKQTGNYSQAMSVAGLMPLLGVVALFLFWGKTQPRTEIPPEASEVPPEEPVEEHVQPALADRVQASPS